MKRVAHQVEAKKVEAKAQRMVAAQAKRDEKKDEAKTQLRPFDRSLCEKNPPEVAVQKIDLLKPDPYKDGDLVCCRWFERACPKCPSHDYKEIQTKSQCLSHQVIDGYKTPKECPVEMWCEALAHSTTSSKSEQ